MIYWTDAAAQKRLTRSRVSGKGAPGKKLGRPFLIELWPRHLHRVQSSRHRGNATGRRLLGCTLSLSAVLWWSSSASADPSEVDPTIGYNYSEIEIPRHAATGGAQRALASSIGALFVNPAGIAVGRVYHLGGLVQLWPEAKRQSYGAAASDSLLSSTKLAGGIGVTYNIQDPDGVDRKWTDLRFAFAYPFSEQFFFGLGGRVLWLDQKGAGPLPASAASGGLRDENILRTPSFDAGVILKATSDLSFAVVGNNLGNPGHGFLPTSIGGGIGFGRDQFAAEVDLVADLTTWERTTLRAMGGLELLLAERFALRAGYRYDQGAESHAVSLGGGYIERAFLLDFGVRRTVTGPASTTAVFGFTYHFEATGLAPTAGETF